MNDDDTRLSVAESHAVRHGRPWMGIALVAGCVLALAAVTVALVLAVRPQPAVKARPHRVHHHHAAVATPSR
ncbi:MAG: hypothetical protein J7518_01035 [Nocardioidaceae bacterium]|nr:hypothetical protein [Nocardioidaceae bacterium]